MLVRVGKRLIRTEAITQVYRDGANLRVGISEQYPIRLEGSEADLLEAFLSEEAVHATSTSPPVLRLVLERWHELPARRGDIEEACRLILKDICGDRVV